MNVKSQPFSAEPSAGDEGHERQVPAVALQVGGQKRGGRAAQALPGLADGPVREPDTAPDAAGGRQRPRAHPLPTVQPLLCRAPAAGPAAATIGARVNISGRGLSPSARGGK